MRITRQTVDRADLLLQYAQARHAEDEAKRRRLLIEEELIADMTRRQEKTSSAQDGGKKYQVTFVQGETTSINEESLRKSLGATRYRKYTVEKLDRKKLEAAMELGEVDPIVVGQHVTVKASNPYLRFTEKDAGSDEHSG